MLHFKTGTVSLLRERPRQTSSREMFLFVTVLCTLATVNSLSFPPHLPKCPAVTNGSQVEEFQSCFKNTTISWRPYLKKGIPELGIPQLEDVVIPQIKIEQTDSLSYNLTISNLSVIGLTDYKMDYFKYDFPNHTYHGALVLDLLQLNGTYDLIGNFLGLGFENRGPWQANLTNLRINGSALGHIVTKKGERHLNFTKIDVNVQIGGASAHLDNFFGEYESLNSFLNEILNDFNVIVIDAVKPTIKKVIKRLSYFLAKRFSKIPYEDLFSS